MKYVKPIVRILLSITLVVVLILAFVKMPRQHCERIQAVAHTHNESVILSQTDIESLLSNAKIEIIGKAMKEIDLGEVITLLKNNPFIETVNFVHFAGKKLVIDYTLREIVLHVFTPSGEHYFVDSKGEVIVMILYFFLCKAVADQSRFSHPAWRNQCRMVTICQHGN